MLGLRHSHSKFDTDFLDFYSRPFKIDTKFLFSSLNLILISCAPSDTRTPTGLDMIFTVFGKDAIAGYRKELNQMHQRHAFEPLNVEDLAQEEKKNAQNAIILLEKK